MVTDTLDLGYFTVQFRSGKLWRSTIDRSYVIKSVGSECRCGELHYINEYRLPNDAGVLNTEFFYAQHEDVIDRLDITTDEANLRWANGNIGDGVGYGMILPNRLLATGPDLQESAVTDPFLGIQRPFQLCQRGRHTITGRESSFTVNDTFLSKSIEAAKSPC